LPFEEEALERRKELSSSASTFLERRTSSVDSPYQEEGFALQQLRREALLSSTLFKTNQTDGINLPYQDQSKEAVPQKRKKKLPSSASALSKKRRTNLPFEEEEESSKEEASQQPRKETLGHNVFDTVLVHKSEEIFIATAIGQLLPSNLLHFQSVYFTDFLPSINPRSVQYFHGSVFPSPYQHGPAQTNTDQQ
jgi:hypothetical protein